jgi:TRAP-type mannitol/chloroaromatic compound transport system substrate-binding protein
MDAAFKAAFAVYGELSGTNPAWKKIYTDYNAFLREENLWFRFTESAFDNYMQGQRIP